MKRVIVSIAILFSVIGFGQQEENNKPVIRQYEIKLNGLFLVLGALEVEYERLLNEESGFGASVLIGIDDDITETLNYSFTPYYRFYFSKKYAQGFFVEGFGMLNSYDNYEYFYNDYNGTYSEDTKTYTDFALGIGVGGKWVTNRGLMFQLNGGIGRNLFNSNDRDFEIVGRAGLTIGYRF